MISKQLLNDLRKESYKFQVTFQGEEELNFLEDVYSGERLGKAVQNVREILRNKEVSHYTFYPDMAIICKAGREYGAVLYIQLIRAYLNEDTQDIFQELNEIDFGANEQDIVNHDGTNLLRLWFDKDM